MRKIAYDILKDMDLSEDAVQEAFEKLTKYAFEIDSVNSNKTKTFMVIITRNVSIEMIRRNKIEIIDEAEFSGDIELLYQDDGPLPLEVLIREENYREMHIILDELDPKYGDLIDLKYYYDWSDSKLADFFNITEQNIRVRLHRAKKLLANKILERRFSVEQA